MFVKVKHSAPTSVSKMLTFLNQSHIGFVVPLTVIGQRLASMNLLSPLAVSDEFSTVRLQHNRAFTELLHAASSSLYPQVTGVFVSVVGVFSVLKLKRALFLNLFIYLFIFKFGKIMYLV